MAKIRLTKNELKRQKDALKMFLRYLPVLQLKKQQLQLEIARLHGRISEVKAHAEAFRQRIQRWIAVFGEDIGLEKLISARDIVTKEGNVAGAEIPVFDRVEFEEKDYSFTELPVWADYGISAVKEMIVFKAKLKVLERQLELLKEELRTTAQRVNLFEKVRIPQARDNIRRINIWLGDLQTASVVTGKIAKAAIHDRKEEALV